MSSPRVGILAQPESWYFRDLQRAARELQLDSTRIDFRELRTWMRTGEERFQLPDHRDSPSPATPHEIPCDVLIVRSMPAGSLEQVVFRMDVLQRMAAAGVRVINSPKSLECAIDKCLTTAKLLSAGLPVPETIVCESAEHAQQAFELLGRDVVVKPLFGSEGRGILRLTDEELAARTFRTLERLQSVLYLQRFVHHPGYDLRLLVLNGRVLGAMKRFSGADFRTNASLGNRTELHRPDALEMELAVHAAAATETFFAGVDLIADQSGQQFVLEVNAVPGWQAFQKVHPEIDVARTLLENIIDAGLERLNAV